MPKETHKPGYGPLNALAMNTVEDALVRLTLAAKIHPEITRFEVFPHNQRKEGLMVEVPPLPDVEYFRTIIRNLIKEAQGLVHRQVMMQEIIVRFVPDICIKDPITGKVIEASGQTVADKQLRKMLIEVSLSTLKSQSEYFNKHWIYFAIRTIFHEIFETDYDVRMRLNEIPLSPHVSEFDPGYTKAPHEQYADYYAGTLIATVFSAAPDDYRQIALGSVEKPQIRLQTRAMDQLARSILEFLAEQE